MMVLEAAIRHFARELHADLEGRDGHWVLEITLAERRAGAQLHHLRYRITIDEEANDEVAYFEDTLWERADHKGLDLGGALRPKEEAFVVAGITHGNVDKQAMHFEKRYQTRFDLAGLRRRLSEACKAEGYVLRHLVPLEGGEDEGGESA